MDAEKESEAKARAKFGNLKAHPNPAQRIMKGSERKYFDSADWAKDKAAQTSSAAANKDAPPPSDPQPTMVVDALDVPEIPPNLVRGGPSAPVS